MLQGVKPERHQARGLGHIEDTKDTAFKPETVVLGVSGRLK
jgi:hypothetical protein